MLTSMAVCVRQCCITSAVIVNESHGQAGYILHLVSQHR